MAQRLGADLSIDWNAGEAAGPAGTAEDGPAAADPVNGLTAQAGHGAFGERQAVERSYLRWLGPALVAAREAHRREACAIHFETPPGIRYTFDGAIATRLGPRDEDWLGKAIDDPRVAIDVAPWWADATDAKYLLNRALCLMWTEVRWRPAVDADEQKLPTKWPGCCTRHTPLTRHSPTRGGNGASCSIFVASRIRRLPGSSRCKSRPRPPIDR